MDYLRPFLVAPAAAALLAAHLFLSASESLRRPSAVIPPLRFAFAEPAAGAAADADAAGVPAFFAAHLSLSASESLRRPSAVIPPLRLAFLPPVAAPAVE